MGQSNLTRAISDLADLFEFGHLQAETDPASLLDGATHEIVVLRKFVADVLKAGSDLGREPDFDDPFEGPVAAATGEMIEALSRKKGADDQ